MAQEIRLALIWHMHQPDYRDPFTGMHLLPWVRLHAARGYTDLAHVTEEYPFFRQTINFSPVLLDQIGDLVQQPQNDYFLDLALKPAEDLSTNERDFLLRHCFFISWDVHVKTNMRYNRLLMKRGTEVAGLDLEYTRARFTKSDYRDLVVLFMLAWCGFTLRKDPAITALIRKEQGYSEDDKRLLSDKITECVNQVISRHGRLNAQERIELTCSPFHHPILPLLIDTQVRPDHHPNTPVFRYPMDARRQLSMGMDKFKQVFGHRPAGMWPSEGSISQEAAELIQDAGIKWIAGDEALLLDKSTGTKVPEGADPGRPWLIGKPDKLPLVCCFRNRGLSDDIGFQYSWKTPVEAVKNFVGNLENIAKAADKNKPPPLITLVCDGDNPWEHYPDGGEGFLTGLAHELEHHPLIKMTTPSEYIMEFPVTGRVEKLGAGSWIGGNFDIWIGCDEDRTAWRVLGDVRKKLDEVFPLPSDSTDEIGTDQRRKVLEHLWVAEGSDWFWWYGEPFNTPLDYVFDIIFRRRLVRALELMGLDVPAELLVPLDPKLPIDSVKVEAPLDVISPEIDGKITTFYEWSGAGHLKASLLEGLVARQNPGLVTDLYFGADTENLYIRLDIEREMLQPPYVLLLRVLKPSEVNLALDLNISAQNRLRLYKSHTTDGHHHIDNVGIAAVGDIVEMSIPITALEAVPRSTVSFTCLIMNGAERIDACPLFGAVSVIIPDEKYLASLWRE